ncbi:hypothetical protein [Natrinema salinisoli]|uniref:hypothetical protein n=1 Tax=Natrinema salinisoli TaxID=2878535 RepID=UPI001CF05D28|nr:hypothetical protein [Natrinema salinisoli]
MADEDGILLENVIENALERPIALDVQFPAESRPRVRDRVTTCSVRVVVDPDSGGFRNEPNRPGVLP